MSLFLAAAALLQARPDSPSSVSIVAVEARLFYQETGRLSDNILDRTPAFIGHNTVIGEGDAEEYAKDMLITVRIAAQKFTDPEPHKYIESPVEVIVKDRRGRIIGSRVWDSILTSDKGVEVKALWLNDATCAGEMTIIARYNGASRTSKIVMGCGE
jgi:hypothetical protein